MRANEKRTWVYTFYLFLLAAMFMVLAGYRKEKDNQEDTALWTEEPVYESNIDNAKLDAIRQQLQGEETLIDYQFQGSLAYTFISTRGRTDYGDLFVVFEQVEQEGAPDAGEEEAQPDSGEEEVQAESGKQEEQPGSAKQKSYTYKRIYTNDFLDLKPWKLILADIDGDGRIELLTAVRKTTYYDTQEKNRFFVFHYSDKKLVKKWTGSQIAGTWRDFIVGELLPAKGEEIIFISEDESGKEKLMVYSWFDFGFQALAESEGYENITGLVITGENQIELTYHAEEERKTILTVKKGKIIEVES